MYTSETSLKYPSEIYQFADDVTNSKASRDLSEVLSELENSYRAIQGFTKEKGLRLNPDKTQLIIFKQPSRRLPEHCFIEVDGCKIEPEPTVKLLSNWGYTWTLPWPLI